MSITLRSFNRLMTTGAAATVTALAMSGCGIQNGNGNYVGVVSRFQTDGILDSCQTWEGEIAGLSNRGGRNGGGAGSTMHFTIKDKDLAAQVEEAMLKQTPLRVEFRHVSNPWSCTQGSHDIITKVEPLGVALNSPFGGKSMAGVTEEIEVPAAAAGSGAQRILICTEAAQAHQGAANISVPAPVAAPSASAAVAGKPLPTVLQLRR